jgi:CPA1 family monovalent cation:H+ antiporter
MLAGGAEPSVLGGLASFLKVFLGGIVVGWAMARVFVGIIGRLENMPLVEQSLTISLAYLSFIVAEHYLHVSGVMAVVVAALVLGSRGRTVIQPHDWHSLHETWEQIGFWANSIIFILVGLAVPAIMDDFGSTQLLWLAVLIVAAFVARAVILFGLLPLLARLGLAQQVSTGFITVMFWGGLRGAVALALALIIIETPGYSDAVREFVGVLVTGFVLFTLFVNAPTIGVVIRFFRLDQLSATDAALRDRALALALGRIGESIERVARRQDTTGETTEEVAGTYRARSEEAERNLQALRDLPVRDWVQVGLTNLTARERDALAHQFEDGFLSSHIYRMVGEQLDDIGDALKERGPDGYETAALEGLGFGRGFHFAMALQRRFGFAGPLSRRVAERFEVLTSTRLALRDLMEDGLPKVRELVGEQATSEVERILEVRLEETTASLEGLEKQYPDYARRIEQRLLERGALRLEEQSYRRMYEDALITGEVFGDLADMVRAREREIATLPPLDLGLDPQRLVGRVPLFRDLSGERIDEIARLLEPRLVVPGEMVVHEGDAGDAMYFISNGSLRVELEPEPVLLGSGDFFGELALITHQPRNADVVATGFADLLVLRTSDFQKLMEANPDAKKRIEAVAAERLGNGANPDSRRS